jgi:hypothetical protein
MKTDALKEAVSSVPLSLTIVLGLAALAKEPIELGVRCEQPR